MATDSPPNSFSSSSNKRLKTLIPNSFPTTNQKFEEKQDAEDNYSLRKVSISTAELESLSCGICLCDNGKAIRGQIDSCDHFFCFVCIMEWAKVESRCPMCKRRFSTIRRPPKDGVFPPERLVHVLKRDQVYYLSGNATVGPPDPYAHVECIVCHSSADESLLLLCDLCDSAAHTYCVGLGFTVPEGDWFCHDCAVSKTEHENIQKDEEDVNHNLWLKSNEMISAEPHVMIDVAASNQSTSENSNAVAGDKADVSIFDIVRESNDPLLPRLRARSLPFPCERQPNLSDEMNLPGERTRTRLGKRTPQSDLDTQNGARTLSRCRNAHSYVRVLRENWNPLRSGSLKFSSTSTVSSGTSIGNHNSLAVSNDSSGLLRSSSSTSDKQVTTNDGLRGITAKDGCSHDVDKAWKMLDKAKSGKQACRRIERVHCVSKNPSFEGTSSGKATNTSSNLHLSNNQVLATTGLGNSSMTEKQHKLYSSEKETHKHLSMKFRMQKHRMTMGKVIVGSNDNRPNNSPRFSASRPYFNAQTGGQINACYENRGLLIQKKTGGASENFTEMQDRSGILRALVGSMPQASALSNNKVVLEASSSCKAYIADGDVKSERDCTESSTVKADYAKSEIQSLVKLNLKLLNGDKQLGVNGFKEVARLATHTILAACGFGHSKHVFHCFPRSVCCHSDRLQQLRKSTLMENSCRECFYIFVRDVVNLVLSEKLSHLGASK